MGITCKGHIGLMSKVMAKCNGDYTKGKSYLAFEAAPKKKKAKRNK